MLIHRLVKMCLIVVTAVSAVSCKPAGDASQQRLPIHNQEQAKKFIHGFFSAYLNNDFETVVRMLCDQDQSMKDTMKMNMDRFQATQMSQRPSSFEVRSVIPMWIGREPYYRAEISFPLTHQRGHFLEAYSIRVQEGCVEAFADNKIDESLSQPTKRERNEEEKILLPQMSQPQNTPRTVPLAPLETPQQID